MDRIEPSRLLWIAGEHDLTAAGCAAEAGGFALVLAAGVPEARVYLQRSRIDAVIVCMPLAEYSRAEVLAELQGADSSVPMVLWYPRIRLQGARRWIKVGDFAVFGAEAGPAQLAAAVRQAIDNRRGRVANTVEIAIGMSRAAAPANANCVRVPSGGRYFDQSCSRIACAMIEEALRKTNENKKILAKPLN